MVPPSPYFFKSTFHNSCYSYCLAKNSTKIIKMSMELMNHIYYLHLHKCLGFLLVFLGYYRSPVILRLDPKIIATKGIVMEQVVPN